MIRRELTDGEMDTARRITRERQENKREHNVTSQKVDDSQGEDEVALVGTMGEVACAHEFDMQINGTISASGDGGWDVRQGGVTAEVKTRRGEEGDFAMYDASTDIDAELAILCWFVEDGQKDLFGGAGANPEVYIVGWLSRAEWLMLAETLHFGDWRRRGVRYQNMRNPAVLQRLLKHHV